MKSEISNKASEMRAASVDEAADLLKKIAGERRADETLKAVFRRLKRRLSDWSDNRIRDVWRRDARIRIRAEEVDQLRAIYYERSDGAHEDELAELRSTVARLAKYEALLEQLAAGNDGSAISGTSTQAGKTSPVLGSGGVRMRS